MNDAKYCTTLSIDNPHEFMEKVDTNIKDFLKIMHV